MNQTERLLYRLAIIALIMSLSMTSLSAYIRISDSSVGCSPWPDCQSLNYRIDPQPGISIASTDENKGLRMLHRFVASTLGIVATLLMIVSLWYRRIIHITPTLPLMCFTLTILLALVGLNTPDILHPVITLMNLTGGMLTTAVAWLLVLHLQKNMGKQFNAPRDWLNLANIWLVIIAIASGAWVSGNFASGACESYLSCDSLSPEQLRDAFNINRELRESGGQLIFGDTQPTIEWGHHLLTLLVCFSLIVSSLLNFASARAPVITILGIAASLMLLGIFQTGQPSLLSAWIHNFWSVLLLLAVVYQYFHGRTQGD